MFDFEYFNPNLGSITVSIAEYGLTFSRAAVEVLGKPEFVLLAFDKNKKVIGIIPVSNETQNKIEFISKQKNGYVRINTKDFIRFLMRYFPDNPNMFSSKSIRYLTYFDDEANALIVDLTKPLDSSSEDDDVQIQESFGEQKDDAEKI